MANGFSANLKTKQHMVLLGIEVRDDDTHKVSPMSASRADAMAVELYMKDSFLVFTSGKEACCWLLGVEVVSRHAPMADAMAAKLHTVHELLLRSAEPVLRYGTMHQALQGG